MSIQSVANLLDVLDKHHLLNEEQAVAVRSTLQPLYSDPRNLARELVRRGWLSPYQVNHIFQDRAPDLVVGTYVLSERLGEGGMGQVFKARHSKLGRIVALKIIRKDRLQNAEALRRFHRETQAAAQLSHPNVVLAYDADRIGDSHFIAMEYVDGIDLSRLVKEQGPLPVEQACEYIRQGALGLQHAFERGLVHRDIKPGNLLLAREPGKDGAPVVKLLDLGLARVNFPDTDDANTLTCEGEVVGTPDFLAPEQARNAHRADIRADVYSLGCTLFFLLTGRAPFAGGTLTEKLLKHHWDAPPPIESVRPGVSPHISAVIARALAKRPEDRFQTPAELATALEMAVHASPVAAVPLSAMPVVGLPVAPLIAPPTHNGGGFPTASLMLDPETGEVPAVPTSDGMLAALPAEPFSPAVTPRPSMTPALNLGAPRRPQMLLRIAVIVGVLLMGATACLVAFLVFRPQTVAPRKTVPTATGTVEVAQSPLDKLRNESLPKAERFSWQPKELVAILGEHAGRHTNTATCIAYSPEGSVLVSAGRDRVARLWSPETLREQFVFTFPNKGGEITALAVSPDGKLLACGDMGGTIRLCPLQPPENRTILTLESHEDAVTGLAFTADGKGLFSSSIDKSAILWELGPNPRRRSRVKTEFTGHEDRVTALALSRGDTFLVTGDDGGKVRLWDLTANEPAKPISWKASDEGIRAIAISPNGKLIVTGADEKPLHVWDAATGKPAKAPTIDTPADVHSLTFAADGRILVCGQGDGYVSLIEMNRGQPMIRERFRAGSPVMAVAVPSRRNESFSFAAATFTGLVRVWDVKNNGIVAPRSETHGHVGGVTGLSFSSDGKRLASSSYDGSIRLWDLATDLHERVLLQPGQGSPINAVVISSDGTRIAGSAMWDPWLRVYDGEGVDKGSRQISQGDKAGGGALAFSPDSRLLAFGGLEGQGRGLVRLLDAASPTMRELGQYTGHSDRVTAIAFYDAGHKLATAGGDDRTVRLWDRAKFNLLKRLDQPTTPVTALAVSRDDELAAGEEGLVRRWDLRSPEVRELASLTTDGGSVTSISYSPDGDLLAISSATGRIMVWDLNTRKLVQNWFLPPSANVVAFAPDGRHLAAGNANGTIYLFRLKAPSIR
jgi:WD40 repeat protein/serine/threonine protein kinase